SRGGELNISVVASDPDAEPMILSAEGLPSYPIPDFMTFTDHGDGTGTLHVAPAGLVRGSYPITVHVHDGGDGDRNAVLRAEATFIVTATAPNDPPRLDSLGARVLVVGESSTFTVRATDPDFDGLVFTADGLPAGATFTPASSYGTAAFSWTPSAADA